MDFKCLIMQDVDNKYREMIGETTDMPLSQKPVVSSYSGYENNRNGYLRRLEKEKNEFNSAIKKINDTKKDRLTLEVRRAEKKREKREMAARKLKITFYCFGVIALTLLNLVFAHTAMKEAFMDVGGGLGLPWQTLWPSWIALLGACLFIGLFSLWALDDPSNGMWFMVLEVLAVLILGIVLACKDKTEIWLVQCIWGTVRMVVAYVVPVGGCLMIAGLTCLKDV